MQMAFCLFKYFPYGGLQRDFMQFYQAAVNKGHKIRVYCIEWQGERPAGIDIHFVPAKSFTNPGRNSLFENYILNHLESYPVDLVVGFNKIAGLDVYYAADSCYEYKAQCERGWFYRQTPRYKHFSKAESEIFFKGKKTKILLISDSEKEKFIRFYDTEPERMFMLPPGIPKDRRAPENAQYIRKQFRQEYGLNDDEKLLLFIGSGFIKKGLGRAILALASLTKAQQKKTRLFVIGQDKEYRYKKLAEKHRVSKQVVFLGGRDDVPRFLLGADLLIHPALDEAAGIVILEAVVAGLPVLVTDVCGYAHHIAKAVCGIVLRSPFVQAELNRSIGNVFDENITQQWKANALEYANKEDLYSMHQTGIKIMEETCEQLLNLNSGKHA